MMKKKRKTHIFIIKMLSNNNKLTFIKLIVKMTKKKNKI